MFTALLGASCLDLWCNLIPAAVSQLCPLRAVFVFTVVCEGFFGGGAMAKNGGGEGSGKRKGHMELVNQFQSSLASFSFLILISPSYSVKHSFYN